MSSSSSELPPRPERRRHVVAAHGEERIDDLHWLRDRNDAAVRAHLEAENAWLERVLAPTGDLREQLYREMLARIEETDESVPYREGGFWYYDRTFEGRQYVVHCRRQGTLEAPEQVILDENDLAAGHGFLHVGALEPSPDHRLLAYAVDHEGDERYEIRVRDLETGRDLPDRIGNASDSIAWANDNRTFFYVTLDETLRPFQVWRHRLGQDAAADVLVFQEDDERLFVSVERTLSDRFLVIDAAGHVTSEQRVLEADRPDGEFRLIEPRRRGVEYGVIHHGERFFILTNDEARNFRLMEAPVAAPGRAHWREVLGHRDDVYLVGATAFRDHLVVHELHLGLSQLRVRRLSTGDEHLVQFDEPAYTVAEGDNAEFDTTTLRFEYSSLTTPRSVYDYDLLARTRELKKRTRVKGGYDPARYAAERLLATAPDGARVPISLVYRKGTRDAGPAPMLLVGYGAYGIAYSPRFASDRLSLLDRGWIYAIAHVRGGADLGRPWYESGKFLHKENTFSDFIACAEHLVREGYTAPDRLTIQGGSAGGLLIGAVVNRRPDLFRAAVLQVPFLDVLNAMLDENLPLTVSEYEEWGNPQDKAYYDAIRAYSPCDNVRPQAYPAMLLTGGFTDPRVPYWDPIKFAARVRDANAGDQPVLVKINLDSGHQGASGRYDYLRERALELAFLLHVVR